MTVRRLYGSVVFGVLLVALFGVVFISRPTEPVIDGPSPSPPQQHQQQREQQPAVVVAPRRRIRYRLVRNRSSVFNGIYEPLYICQDAETNPRKREPAQLYDSLDVGGTRVETDLNLIFMGDSVSIQFSQAFEEAAGAVRDDRVVLRITKELIRGHEKLTFEGLHASVTSEGGWVAGWRQTGMLLRAGENQPLPNNEPPGGWTRRDAVALFDAMKRGEAVAAGRRKNNNDNDNSSTRNSSGSQSFDTMIFRIPVWVPFRAVNNQTLTESIELAHELFGIKSIILVSLPLCNNYATSGNIVELVETNELLREFARKWNSGDGDDSGVEHVLVLDLAELSWLLVSANAQHLNLTGPMTYVYAQKLEVYKRRDRYPPAQAHVCSARMSPATGDCIRNFLTFDGMHWCMDIIEGRFVAGVACLLACLHNDKNNGASGDDDKQSCAERCNHQYMSLEPIPDEKFGISLS